MAGVTKTTQVWLHGTPSTAHEIKTASWESQQDASADLYVLTLPSAISLQRTENWVANK